MRSSWNGRGTGQRLIEGLFLACVALALLLPALAQALGGGGPQSDNRRLAAAPTTPRDATELLNWPRAVDAYLNDHFGLRRQLVDADGNLRWRLLDSSPSSAVVVGRNHRLFLSEGDTPFRVLLSNCGAWWDDQQVHEFAQDDAQAIDRLTQLAPEISVLVIPTAAALYPSDLPTWISDACVGHIPLVDQIRQRLPAAAQSRVSYPLEAAATLSLTSPMYPKPNFHWNGPGISSFLSRVAEQEWGMTRRSAPSWADVEKTSDLSVYLPGVALRYRVSVPQWSGDGVESCVEDACATRFPLEGVKTPSEFTRLSRRGAGPKLLLLSDSFGSGAATSLFGYFDDIIVINVNNFPRLSAEDRRRLWERVSRQWRPDRILMLMQDGNFTGLPRFADGFSQL